jgi:hypothetical protein
MSSRNIDGTVAKKSSIKLLKDFLTGWLLNLTCVIEKYFVVCNEFRVLTFKGCTIAQKP